MLQDHAVLIKLCKIFQSLVKISIVHKKVTCILLMIKDVMFGLMLHCKIEEFVGILKSKNKFFFTDWNEKKLQNTHCDRQTFFILVKTFITYGTMDKRFFIFSFFFDKNWTLKPIDFEILLPNFIFLKIYATSSLISVKYQVRTSKANVQEKNGNVFLSLFRWNSREFESRIL